MPSRFGVCGRIALTAALLIAAGMAPAVAAASRHTLLVGPTRALHTPSAAAAVAKDGDRIAIDPGTYDDCAVWRQNRLLIEGVRGQPRIQGKVCQDQALWLIRGTRIVVANVAFADAHSTANNGAGIKFTGRDLTVRNGVFIHNENGILVGPNPNSHVRIVASQFRLNGKCEPVCAHGIYASHIALLNVTGSKFERQRVGHHIKSRALATELIGNRIEDGLDGTASFSVDLPNGGTAMIRGNYFQKGPKSQNRMTFISIGEEGAINPSRGIAIVQNSFLCNEPNLDSFVWNRTKRPAVLLKANSFAGSTAPRLKGPGRVER
jgi:hypothetical protein